MVLHLGAGVKKAVGLLDHDIATRTFGGEGGNEKRHIDCRKVQERKVLAMRSAVSISKIPLRPFAFSKGANGEKLGCPLSSYCWGEAPTQIAFLTSRFI